MRHGGVRDSFQQERGRAAGVNSPPKWQPQRLGPCTRMGDPNGVPNAWLWAGPEEAIRGVTQHLLAQRPASSSLKVQCQHAPAQEQGRCGEGGASPGVRQGLGKAVVPLPGGADAESAWTDNGWDRCGGNNVRALAANPLRAADSGERGPQAAQPPGRWGSVGGGSEIENSRSPESWMGIQKEGVPSANSWHLLSRFSCL